MNKQREKINYKVRSIRLDKKIWKELKNRRKLFRKSWNLFVVALLKKWDS